MSACTLNTITPSNRGRSSGLRPLALNPNPPKPLGLPHILADALGTLGCTSADIFLKGLVAGEKHAGCRGLWGLTRIGFKRVYV